MPRTHSIARNTKETDVKLELNLDGTGAANVSTGIGFFDHMLTLFAKHGLFDLTVDAKGDLESNPAFIGIVQAANDDCRTFLNDNDPRFPMKGAA